ncbi:MAG: PqqD family protein [Thermodesulfobacteriota bacterium]
MTINLSPDAVYVPSQDVVAREIEGEIIIVPLAAGIGDMEDELFTLNPTGMVIWQKLDGKKTLRELIEELIHDYDAAPEEIEKDVAGLMTELLKRKILVEASSG